MLHHAQPTPVVVPTRQSGSAFVTTALATAIFVAGVLGLSLYQIEFDPFLGLILSLIVGISGLVALLSAALGARRDGDREHCIRAGLITLIMWAMWIFGALDQFGEQAWFWMERPYFDRSVREAAEGMTPSCVASKRCFHEPGRAADLVFPLGGLLNNWRGVVHSPTWEDPSVERNPSSFVGEWARCKHLSGPYFLCGFT